MTAARSLDVEIVRGIDIPDGLRETWDVPLALDFSNSETALRHLVDYCRAQPVNAIVALDDNATLLATRAAAALGLPHNPLEAAEAARDKGLMRERFAAYGVPSPVFRRVPLASDPQEIAGQVRYPCVVKPLRLNGSKGVIRADDPPTFVAAFTRLRRILVGDGYPLDRTEILVEDYLPGGEVALEELILRHALGFAIPSFDRAGAAAGVMMIPIPKTGMLREVSGIEEAQEVPHIEGVEITARLRAPILALPEGNSYLGFIFARAEDPATAEAALRASHARLRFDIRPLLAMV